MLREIGQALELKLGDEFFDFSKDGQSYFIGTVDGIAPDHATVDFGDYRKRYEMLDIIKLQENCGYIREYFTAPTEGEVVEVFD